MKFTFLTQEQVFGEEKLSIFNSYSPESTISDFALLLGGTDTNYIQGVHQHRRVSWWWTKTPNMKGDSLAIKTDDLMISLFINHRDIGARPAFKYSDIITNEINYDSEILMVYYGEYPQTVVSLEYSRVLESVYQNHTIKVTGKKYTTDLVDSANCTDKFKEKIHEEYEYGGKKYIRFVNDSTRYSQCLSDGRIINKDEVYWIEVEPIKWLIDKKSDIAFSEQILFSGIQFNNQRDYAGNFDTTDIKQYMDKYFSCDIIPSLANTIEKSSREEYIDVLNDLTTRLYNKANNTLNELGDSSLRYSDEKAKLILDIQNILEEINDVLKVMYNSQYIDRTRVIAYLNKHINTLDIIEYEVNNLTLDSLGLGEFKLTKDEYAAKGKVKKLTCLNK